MSTSQHVCHMFVMASDINVFLPATSRALSRLCLPHTSIVFNYINEYLFTSSTCFTVHNDDYCIHTRNTTTMCVTV